LIVADNRPLCPENNRSGQRSLKRLITTAIATPKPTKNPDGRADARAQTVHGKHHHARLGGVGTRDRRPRSR
jgi:hypothetical protein